MAATTMRDYEKRQTLRRLWLERPSNRRTERDLVLFHEWLAENLPTLLTRGGDSYEQLRQDLGDLCEAISV
ncbi:MAG: hypothetical protein IT185_01185 [Acidobacteria bacterium]|nr:hypothetical protein [Acidobacteriota bacterium]